ncbi:hypothetical protein KP509_20G049200 [Ceratopteris richardii]|uniref:Glycine cleavage system H protein n=1 Tax=Ceratopteris richardii TaxID=49495 RepID=A0A8T2SJ30_CERRI|nr:hypothetical protein KP509_20G049200 [Ceratopteris richardii]
MALRALASRTVAALRISSRADRFVPIRTFSSKFPEDLKYAKTHEWLKAEGEKGTMGLTSFAVEELGDVVYVELPDVGSKYESGESICTVESVKASSSVYAPAGGEVLEVNESLKDAPERLNKEPYGEWLVKLKLANAKDLDSLLDAHAYHAVTKKEKH